MIPANGVDEEDSPRADTRRVTGSYLSADDAQARGEAETEELQLFPSVSKSL